MKPTPAQKRARRIKRKLRDAKRPVTKDTFKMFNGAGHRPTITRFHQRALNYRKEILNKNASELEQPQGTTEEQGNSL